MTIPSGCALALDYVPVIDWADVLKSATRSSVARDVREAGINSDNPDRVKVANGTIPGMGNVDVTRAKKLAQLRPTKAAK